MLRMLVGMALAASPVSAQVMLGPSGLPSREPFPLITEEYVADYEAAKLCPLKSFEDGDVYEGQLAIYHKRPDGEVEVMQEEFARRYALNYCWK